MFDRIICIGDSITKGKVWRETERRPYITEMSYPAILGNLMNIDVLNRGVCDITSNQVLSRIINEITFEKGSIVIVEVGGNDCNLNWRDVKKNPNGQHNAAVPLENFKENLIKIIEIFKRNGVVPILSTLPPLDGERYYNLLKTVFGEGIKTWIDKNGGIYNWQEKYSNMVKYVSDKTETYLIDIRKAFLESENYRDLMSFDGIHPNENGYLLMAHSYYRQIKGFLDNWIKGK